MDPIFNHFYIIKNQITKKIDYHFNIEKSEIKSWRSKEKNSVNWKAYLTTDFLKFVGFKFKDGVIYYQDSKVKFSKSITKNKEYQVANVHIFYNLFDEDGKMIRSSGISLTKQQLIFMLTNDIKNPVVEESGK